MKSRGNIIILMVVMFAALLPLLGLAIGSGMLHVNKVRIQNSSNLAAYAGLQTFGSSENIGLTVAQRAEKARATVDAIIDKNKPVLSISKSTDAQIYNGSNSTQRPLLTFGNYSKTKPAFCTSSPNDAECKCSTYPCFVPYAAGTELESSTASLRVNSAKVEMKTPVSSFLTPFLSLLGQFTQKMDLNNSAIASVLPRCAVFLLDVSNSSFAESHTKIPAMLTSAPSAGYNLTTAYKSSGYGDSSDVLDNPADHSHDYQLATLSTDNNSDNELRYYKIIPVDSGLSDTLNKAHIIPGNYAIPMLPSQSNYTCNSNADLGSKMLNDARAYWCSMRATRPNKCSMGKTIATCDWSINNKCCAPHYRSDYVTSDTPSGRYAIDRYSLPKPFDSFLESANASLRQMYSTQTSQDQIAVIAFTGAEHGPVPFTGLSSDIRMAIDLTDIRRGIDKKQTPNFDTELSPNYIQRDWFPVDPDSTTTKYGSDILGAVHDAYTRLADEAFCPASAQKTIFLASDGNMSHLRTVNSEDGTVDWDTRDLITNGSDWLTATYALSYAPWPKGSLANLLFKKSIRFVMLLAGNNVGPNFAKIKKPTSTSEKVICKFADKSACLTGDYYTPWELPALGIDGLWSDPNLGLRFSGGVFPMPRFTQQYAACKPAYPDDCKDPFTNTGFCKPIDQNECARLMSPYIPNYPFRLPNGTFAELAIKTGGLFCPLMEPYRKSYPDGPINDACYDSTTGLRKADVPSPECDMTAGEFQSLSIIKGDKGDQAAFCVNMAFGTPAFSLQSLPGSTPGT